MTRNGIDIGLPINILLLWQMQNLSHIISMEDLLSSGDKHEPSSIDNSPTIYASSLLCIQTIVPRASLSLPQIPPFSSAFESYVHPFDFLLPPAHSSSALPAPLSLVTPNRGMTRLLHHPLVFGAHSKIITKSQNAKAKFHPS